MKRSEINLLVKEAQTCFARHGWTLPPHPKWDVTDFGMGDWRRQGLVLVNLAEEPEYCEKLMFARQGMTTPAHCHAIKKEDIICRSGRLAVRIWGDRASAEKDETGGAPVRLKVNGDWMEVPSGDTVMLDAGWRITLTPWIFHAFWPVSEQCVIGEVSTANDDANDNIFISDAIGRFPEVSEDEPPIVHLVSDQ